MRMWIPLALAGLAGCMSSGHTAPEVGAVEKSGTLVTGEYAHFVASDGSRYNLSAPQERDQRMVTKLVSPSINGDEQCIAMRLLGTVSGDVGFNGRPTFVVARIISARRTDCTPNRD